MDYLSSGTLLPLLGRYGADLDAHINQRLLIHAIVDRCFAKFVSDTDSMGMLIHTPTTIIPGSSQPVAVPLTVDPMDGRHTVSVPSPFRVMTASSNRANASISASASTGLNPVTNPSDLHSVSPQSTTLYLVSITMACTRTQLDANVMRLAGIGSDVTIQIDKKS